MGNLVFLVFFLASRSLAVPVEVDDNGAVLGELFPLLDASGGDSQAGQPNLGALFGNMAAVQQGGDAQDGQPNLGDLFGMMGGLMSAMAPEEDAQEIQQQMGEISQILGGIGLAPAGPDSADVSLDSNAGSEGPTAAQQQASTITFAKVPLDHEGRMATVAEVRANLDQAKGLLNEWTLAFIDGGKLCGYGYKAEPGFTPPIEIGDFLHQTHVGEKIIVVE